jgi:hypothetical protein
MTALLCALLLAATPVGSPVHLQQSDLVGTWHRSQDDCLYYLQPDSKCMRRYADTATEGHWKFVPPGRLELFLDEKPLVFEITGYEKHIMHISRLGGRAEKWLRVEQ